MIWVAVMMQCSLFFRITFILTVHYIPINCSEIDFSAGPPDTSVLPRRRFNTTILQPRGFYISMREELEIIKHVKFIIFIRHGHELFTNKLNNKSPDICQDIYKMNGVLWEYANYELEHKAGINVIYRIKYLLTSGKVRITDTRMFYIGMKNGQYITLSGD